MTLTLERPTIHKWTLQDLDLIKRDYRADKVRIQELAEKIGTSEGSVRSRASKLKLTKPPKFWTPEEDERLVDLMAVYTHREVARKLHRTEKACFCRMRELKQSTLRKEDWYTATDVAMILGVERRWVTARITTRMLKAYDHYYPDGDRPRVKTYHISREALINFIREHPTELQGLKPDMVMFVDLLAGIKVSAES